MSKKKLEVNLKWASYDILVQLYKSEKVSKVKTRFLILLYFLNGFNSLEISTLIHQSDSTVRRCLHRYNTFGLDGLKDAEYGHRPSILSDNELLQIDKALSKSPRENNLNYNNWTSKLLVEFVRINFSKSISVNTALSTIHKLNYSKTCSKKMSGKVNKQALEDFRDKLNEIINSKDCNVEIIYEDECIITS